MASDNTKVTVTEEVIMEDLKAGLSKTQIAEKHGITTQKVSGLIRKAANSKKTAAVNPKDEEIPPQAFAKSSGVIIDENMGQSVVMTATEYAEYSRANGRINGRAEGVKTPLNTGELRIALNLRSQNGTPATIKKYLMDKHGITEKDIVAVAYALCKEEESVPKDILMQLGIRI